MRIILGSLWCYGNEWLSEVVLLVVREVKVILRKGPKWKIEKVLLFTNVTRVWVSFQCFQTIRALSWGDSANLFCTLTLTVSHFSYFYVHSIISLPITSLVNNDNIPHIFSQLYTPAWQIIRDYYSFLTVSFYDGFLSLDQYVNQFLV